MGAVNDVLERAASELLGPGRWTLSPLTRGGGSHSWVARDGRRRLFVKAGNNRELLRRLAGLGVVPPIIASQPLDDGDLVVQEFVDGVQPDGRWIDENVAELGRLVRSYHSQPGLHEGVPAMSAATAAGSLRRRLDRFAPRMGIADGVLRDVVVELSRTPTEVGTAEHVLTHGDPNASNFLRSRPTGLFLVDWDDAAISDPLRDVGQILWWYVRPERWANGLAEFGVPDSAPVRDRLFWWAAAESAEVALHHLEHGRPDDAGAFALDALAATRQRHNPRAWWLRDADRR
jgi:aminoglycoside phosphotransferase (APT) family kinase protein